MVSLKQQLAEYGFESRESYDYAINCLLTSPSENIRCLNVDGDPGRRKTAFAHALAQALGHEHVLYYEFGIEKPVPQVIHLKDGEEIPEEPPTQPFDRIMTEACALSEAETTILILDQLDKADFQQHIRLFEFTKSKIWSYSDVAFHANANNLMIFFISNEDLYHSLQQSSFRVWISAQAASTGKIQPQDLDLDESSREWLDSLSELMIELGISPSISEYKRLAYDIESHVRTEEQLRTSIFGWIENVDRKRLYSKSIQPFVSRLMKIIESGFGIQEEIELSSENLD
ncbi:MAG: hypothetical protein OQK76_06005 [Gammaproteobacteria bacterium]|nr:hypothetical protein [Gammaproteobacteria bacterium]MCW8910159.1 hypothetical protein [Gammaproteobacteria bacterium]MCW9006157.1 hypothetical protein [Gammaproteobacteria bacterium]MCW9055445.1 hypothetical protein [Gammaproteobacteria bacterium]